MSSRTATVLSIVVIVAAGVLLYATRLGETPMYVMHDEAQGALQAQAIASTGRDLSGRLLPLYFTEPEFPPGRDPVMIYVTALGLQFLPFSEAGARMPTALVAVVNAVLAFLVARRLFRSTAMGLVAAALLLLTPIHFIRSRLLLSPIYTIPFILGWLWSLSRFEQEPGTKRLVAAAIWLGAGCYTYLAAVVMMPLYLAYTLVAAYRRLGLQPCLKAAAAFGATLVPMAMWYVTHPERNAQIVSVYQLDAAAASPVARWVGLYWAFFDPSFLFVSGDASLINSTRTAGFFPMVFAVLLPIGLVALIRSRQTVPLAIAAGFLTAPLVSMISGAIEMNRIMFAIPFGALTASAGVFVLWERRVAGRVVAAALVLAVAVQFASFYAVYFGDYRTASATWFAGNAREAVRAAMTYASSGSGPIYVSSEIEWAHRTWRFYAIADGKVGMIERFRYVRTPPADAAPGAIAVCPATSTECRVSDEWRGVETVVSHDGSRSVTILQRAEAAAR